MPNCSCSGKRLDVRNYSSWLTSSRLTWGQAKTLMFVHISPELDADGETISTVKFAEQFATVELSATRVNKDSVDVKELKEQIATLKAALARKKENQNKQF
ncbi:unnamed protein product, partial [Vitis vinifera]